MAPETAATVADVPGAWPLLGHLPHLRRGPLEFLTSLSAHGGLVRIHLGPLPVFVLCDAGLVQQMFRAPEKFDKGGKFYDKVRQIISNGLITCAWSDHQRQRALVQPAFTRARLEAYAAVMREEVAATVGAWQPGQAIEIVPQMGALVARITARTLFGSELDPQAVAQVQRALPIVAEGLYRRITSPLGLWERLPTAANRRYNHALSRLHAVIDQVIAGHLHTEGDKGEGDDILSVLLAAREGRDRLSETEIHQQIFTFMGAGIETTAATLSWTLHLLGQHPQIQERMHSEISRVLGGRPPTLKDIHRLTYTRQVLTETMRLYPPVWILTRSTTVDAELGGRPIPAGSTVMFSPYLIHHDARLFPDPERFDPDRWASEQADQRSAHALFPFGGGARKCIGDVFGLTEAVIALAGISTRWRLAPAPGPGPKAVALGALTPDRIIMTAHPRPGPGPQPEHGRP